MAIHFGGFQNFLYGKLILDGKYSLKEVAGKMGILSRLLYNYTSGESYFPVDLLTSLYRATGDREFLDFVINDSDMMLTPRKKANTNQSLITEALDTSVAAGEVVRAVKKAIADGTLNPRERALIVRMVNNNEKELEDVRLLVGA